MTKFKIKDGLWLINYVYEGKEGCAAAQIRGMGGTELLQQLKKEIGTDAAVVIRNMVKLS